MSWFLDYFCCACITSSSCMDDMLVPGALKWALLNFAVLWIFRNKNVGCGFLRNSLDDKWTINERTAWMFSLTNRKVDLHITGRKNSCYSWTPYPRIKLACYASIWFFLKQQQQKLLLLPHFLQTVLFFPAQVLCPSSRFGICQHFCHHEMQEIFSLSHCHVVWLTAGHSFAHVQADKTPKYSETKPLWPNIITFHALLHK